MAGSYGTDYLEGARLAEETLGTQVPSQAVYLSASRARSGTTTTALAGTRSYEIRFPVGDIPPHGSDGFWSITLYNAAGFLVANRIDRYSIGDETPGLVRGADGSLTIVVSASRPSETDVNRAALRRRFCDQERRFACNGVALSPAHPASPCNATATAAAKSRPRGPPNQQPPPAADQRARHAERPVR